MKKRIFAASMILLLLIFVGCTEGKQIEKMNIDEINLKLKEENLLNKIVEDYNKKCNKNLEASKIEIYSVKLYKKGCLVLVGYKNETLELKLFYIEKYMNGSYNLKETTGQYLPKVSVNSLKDGDNTIYFGNISEEYAVYGKELNNSQPKISLSLDDGKHAEEKFKLGNKGYIIIIDSDGMVVDLIFYNNKNEPFNYIKEFVNYSQGIYETTWSAD